MSDIKNPFDSLQDYFDDLLDAEPPVEQALNRLSVANSDVVVEPIPISSAARNKKSPHRASRQTLSSKPNVQAVATPLKREPIAQFAEPSAENKAKLQRLLQTATVPLEVKTEVKTETKTQPKAEVKTESRFVDDPNEIQDWVIETKVEAPVGLAPPVITSPVIAPIVETPLESDANIEQSTETEHIEGLEWLANGRPAWAQSRFDVLLFSVSGLILAVPLISLGQIQPLTKELTPLFGQAEWFMGLLPTSQGKIRTVNTAKFVMPERYDENFTETAKYVMTINGVPWGLAVDAVNQPITLDPEDVKWRTERSKRPWLAGTVKEHMCALLDIPRIGQMLMEADKNLIKKSF